jgi:hypothetical protein
MEAARQAVLSGEAVARAATNRLIEQLARRRG